MRQVEKWWETLKNIIERFSFFCAVIGKKMDPGFLPLVSFLLNWEDNWEGFRMVISIWKHTGRMDKYLLLSNNYQYNNTSNIQTLLTWQVWKYFYCIQYDSVIICKFDNSEYECLIWVKYLHFVHYHYY